MLKMNFSKKADKKEPAIKNSTEEKSKAISDTKKATSRKSTFKIGDTIVYPFHGVGVIERKEKHPIQGVMVDFFVINIKANKMTISIPIDQAEARGIRHLISKSELDEALTHLKDKPENAGVDWKVRQQTNNNLVKKGDILSTIKVIVSLHSRNKEKELPLQERRLYDSSITMLKNEMALVMGVSEDEAEALIKSTLE